MTPRDKGQALDTIRDALDAYLQIPALPDAIRSTAKDIAHFQPEANASHLRGQIALAGAIIEAKDATIRAQAAELATRTDKADLRGYLPASTLPGPSDTEDLIEGVVAVKSLEKNGLVVNLPELLRRLKRRLE